MRQPAHILVVDDDPKVRTLMRRCFEQDGYTVTEAVDGAAMRGEIARRPPSLVTLDLTLPGEDGLALAREIRSTSDVPIIIVTGKVDTIDTVVGLEVGADDYIAKPFHVRELLARVRSVLRRSEPREARAATGPAMPEPTEPVPAAGRERFAFARWQFDLAGRDLRNPEGRSVELTTAEFNLLAVFVRHPNQVLSRDQLMDHLVGREWTPLDRAIDTQVARLRKKIEPGDGPARLVKTIRGVGYLFSADVRRL
jgi:two-component system, OmpR family, response regulator